VRSASITLKQFERHPADEVPKSESFFVDWFPNFPLSSKGLAASNSILLVEDHPDFDVFDQRQREFAS
jgi:hypothetical protein